MLALFFKVFIDDKLVRDSRFSCFNKTPCMPRCFFSMEDINDVFVEVHQEIVVVCCFSLMHFAPWSIVEKFGTLSCRHLGSGENYQQSSRYVYAMCKVVKEMTDLKPAS